MGPRRKFANTAGRNAAAADREKRLAENQAAISAMFGGAESVLDGFQPLRGRQETPLRRRQWMVQAERRKDARANERLLSDSGASSGVPTGQVMPRAYVNNQEVELPPQGILLAQKLNQLNSAGALPAAGNAPSPTGNSTPEQIQAYIDARSAENRQNYQTGSDIYEDISENTYGPGIAVPIPRRNSDLDKEFEEGLAAEVETDLARQETAAEGVQERLSDVQSTDAAQKQAIVDTEEDETGRADLLELAERQIARNERRSEIQPQISQLLNAEDSFQRDYLNVRGRTNQLIFMQGHRKRMRNLESFMEEIEEMDLEDDRNAVTGEGDSSELNKILEELGEGYTVDALSNEQLVLAVGMVSDVREGKAAAPTTFGGLLGRMETGVNELQFGAGLDGVEGSKLNWGAGADGSETVEANYDQFTDSQDYINWLEWKWSHVPFQNDGRGAQDEERAYGKVSEFIAAIPTSFPDQSQQQEAVNSIQAAMAQELYLDVGEEMWEERGGNESGFWRDIILEIYESLSYEQNKGEDGAIEAWAEMREPIVAGFSTRGQ